MKNFPHTLSSVLIVDDNLKNIQVLGNCLKKEGFNIEFAINGASAINWTERKDFDLILLDVMMPEMDGYEVCRLLKRNIKTREIPVIFLTARVDTDSIVKAFDTGGVDYITKPFNTKELLARVRTHVEIKKSRDEKRIYLKEIENKNSVITNSIDHARSIQNAALRSSKHLSEYFPQQFSLTFPKEIVSGDFFWTGKTDDKILLGVFDCTGHGIPGAFMSLLFVSFLNETVYNEKIEEPDKILDRLREKIINSLGQNGIERDVHLGMDAVIISYDPAGKAIQFSGAFSRMYLIRDNNIHEYKGDMMPVAFFDKMTRFSKQEIPVRKDDIIYLFTDGFTDQFGGPANKKFGYPQLKQLLLTNHKESMPDQKNIISEAHLNWKGSEEQLDDITMVAISFRGVHKAGLRHFPDKSGHNIT